MFAILEKSIRKTISPNIFKELCHVAFPHFVHWLENIKAATKTTPTISRSNVGEKKVLVHCLSYSRIRKHPIKHDRQAQIVKIKHLHELTDTRVVTS